MNLMREENRRPLFGSPSTTAVIDLRPRPNSPPPLTLPSPAPANEADSPDRRQSLSSNHNRHGSLVDSWLSMQVITEEDLKQTRRESIRIAHEEGHSSASPHKGPKTRAQIKRERKVRARRDRVKKRNMGRARTVSPRLTSDIINSALDVLVDEPSRPSSADSTPMEAETSLTMRKLQNSNGLKRNNYLKHVRNVIDEESKALKKANIAYRRLISSLVPADMKAKKSKTESFPQIARPIERPSPSASASPPKGTSKLPAVEANPLEKQMEEQKHQLTIMREELDGLVSIAKSKEVELAALQKQSDDIAENLKGEDEMIKIGEKLAEEKENVKHEIEEKETEWENESKYTKTLDLMLKRLQDESRFFPTVVETMTQKLQSFSEQVQDLVLVQPDLELAEKNAKEELHELEEKTRAEREGRMQKLRDYRESVERFHNMINPDKGKEAGTPRTAKSGGSSEANFHSELMKLRDRSQARLAIGAISNEAAKARRAAEQLEKAMTDILNATGVADPNELVFRWNNRDMVKARLEGDVEEKTLMQKKLRKNLLQSKDDLREVQLTAEEAASKETEEEERRKAILSKKKAATNKKRDRADKVEKLVEDTDVFTDRMEKAVAEVFTKAGLRLPRLTRRERMELELERQRNHNNHLQVPSPTKRRLSGDHSKNTPSPQHGGQKGTRLLDFQHAEKLSPHHDRQNSDDGASPKAHPKAHELKHKDSVSVSSGRSPGSEAKAELNHRGSIGPHKSPELLGRSPKPSAAQKRVNSAESGSAAPQKRSLSIRRGSTLGAIPEVHKSPITTHIPPPLTIDEHEDNTKTFQSDPVKGTERSTSSTVTTGRPKPSAVKDSLDLLAIPEDGSNKSTSDVDTDGPVVPPTPTDDIHPTLSASANIDHIDTSVPSNERLVHMSKMLDVIMQKVGQKALSQGNSTEEFLTTFPLPETNVRLKTPFEKIRKRSQSIAEQAVTQSPGTRRRNLVSRSVKNVEMRMNRNRPERRESVSTITAATNDSDSGDERTVPVDRKTLKENAAVVARRKEVGSRRMTRKKKGLAARSAEAKEKEQQQRETANKRRVSVKATWVPT